MIRLGLWGARSDRRGLAIQGAEFARHMRPCKVLGIDQRSVGTSRLKPDWDDYLDAGAELTIIKYPKITRQMALEWLSGLDVVWGCETFYHDDFPAWADEAGVKTIQHVNPEFYRFDNEPKMPRPTLELSPSAWRMGRMSGVSGVLPCPIPLDRLPFVQRPLNNPLVFLHVVGMRAAEDRNGSGCIQAALRYVQEPCVVLVRSQGGQGIKQGIQGNVTVKVMKGDIANYWELYEVGDVQLLPRKYGGQCLPFQEAAACGIPTVMTDIPPQNAWLPPSCLIPAKKEKTFKTQAGLIDIYEPDPVSLAAKMDEMSRNRMLVSELSVKAGKWAASRSWKAMEPLYRAVIDDVTNGRNLSLSYTR